MSSRYGAKFDQLADRWSVVTMEHDLQHFDRSECGGVGGCAMLAAEHDLRERMRDVLEQWCRKP